MNERRKIERLSSLPNSHRLYTKSEMDGPDPKRRKKSDKAKEKFERNGGFSQKHVRLTEELMNKRSHAVNKQTKKIEDIQPSSKPHTHINRIK